MLSAVHEFGSCSELWTAPQPDFSYIYVEKNWHEKNGKKGQHNSYYSRETCSIFLVFYSNEFGFCPKLLTAPQPNISYIFLEKNWHEKNWEMGNTILNIPRKHAVFP